MTAFEIDEVLMQADVVTGSRNLFWLYKARKWLVVKRLSKAVCGLQYIQPIK
jgi:hypothetical protein